MLFPATLYRSAIFYHSPEQKLVAKKIKSFVKKAVTEIVPFTNFYPAENYHQDYYAKNSRMSTLTSCGVIQTDSCSIPNPSCRSLSLRVSRTFLSISSMSKITTRHLLSHGLPANASNGKSRTIRSFPADVSRRYTSSPFTTFSMSPVFNRLAITREKLWRR